MEMSVESFLKEVLHLKDRNVIKTLSDCGEIRHFKRKEILFYQDEEPEYIAFLLDGIMRSFVIDEKGVDSTECFDFTFGCPIVPSLPLNASASVNIEASVGSSLVLFPIDEVVELINTNVESSMLYNNLMCQSMKKFVSLTRALNQYSAAQRYEWFLSEYAPLDGRISSKDIASFLNMSPVTLSHVRKEFKLSQKEKGGKNR